jgi:PAS domain S-box-containing protein
MANRPTYEDLEQRAQELEKKAFEHNREEKRIKNKNGFLDLILESLPHPFYVIDASNYRITATNPAAHLNPLSTDSTCYALTHNRDTPCDPAERPCPVEEIKKTKKPVTLEHVHFDRDGNPKNVQIYAYPIFDTAGNVSQIIEYALDITERKRVVEALWESEAQYRRLVENMNDGLAIHDENRLFSYVNRRFLQIIGFPKDEVVGHSVTHFLDATNQLILEDQIALRKNGKKKQYELTWNHKDGRKIPTLVSPEPILDRNGQWKGSYAVVTEITKLKQLEETLRKSEEEHRMLLETMSEGFSKVDENQVRVYANERLCEMLGYKPDEIVGAPAARILDKTNKKVFKEEFAKRRKGESGAYEITFTRKDGQKVPAIVSPKPLFDENGRFKGSFSVITDITSLKQTELALKEREKELEMQANNLEEVNAALRVLLKQREEDKKELEEKVLFNMKELVEPYLAKLKDTELDDRQEAVLDILESNLNDIISPFSRNLYFSYLNLTPAEMQIAALIRHGRTTKEIASLLTLSSRTVETHRKNIRKKLGLTDKKANLRTKLLSLQ